MPELGRHRCRGVTTDVTDRAFDGVLAGEYTSEDGPTANGRTDRGDRSALTGDVGDARRTGRAYADVTKPFTKVGILVEKF